MFSLFSITVALISGSDLSLSFGGDDVEDGTSVLYRNDLVSLLDDS
jgi:hypothetical protein